MAKVVDEVKQIFSACDETVLSRRNFQFNLFLFRKMEMLTSVIPQKTGGAPFAVEDLTESSRAATKWILW